MSEKDDVIAKVNAHVERSIADIGHAVIAVGGDPMFAYTVGLTETLAHPELFLRGFNPDVAKLTLNHVAQFIRDGHRFGDWSVATQPFYPAARMVTRRFTPNWREHYGRVAASRYGRGFDMLQVILPDQHGHFPGHPECEEPYSLQMFDRAEGDAYATYEPERVTPLQPPHLLIEYKEVALYRVPVKTRDHKVYDEWSFRTDPSEDAEHVTDFSIRTLGFEGDPSEQYRVIGFLKQAIDDGRVQVS